MGATTAVGVGMNRGNLSRAGLGDKLDAVNDCLAVNRTALATYHDALTAVLNTQCLQSGALAEGTSKPASRSPTFSCWPARSRSMLPVAVFTSGGIVTHSSMAWFSTISKAVISLVRLAMACTSLGPEL